MTRTRIKICGITRTEDAIAAQSMGVDALGLVFFPDSPRYIDLNQAAVIGASVEPLTTLVGLFVNPTVAEVERVLAAIPLGLLQFHGEESAEFCQSFDRPWIKALRVSSGDLLKTQLDQYDGARGFLLDAFVDGHRGGTGQSFDWALIPPMPKPYLLAGGLNAENVGVAVEKCRPYGVDVSSGVEATPGTKDAVKMRAFITAVERADAAALETS
jgi:phosphoribosylanthranilate isomerase